MTLVMLEERGTATEGLLMKSLVSLKVPWEMTETFILQVWGEQHGKRNQVGNIATWPCSP